MPIEQKAGESLDDLQNGFFILQGDSCFRYGTDAVLLAAYAKVKPGERALDMGTGTGIIPILLAAKTRGKAFVGLEIQDRSADMASRSVALNHLEDRISIVQGDIKEAASIFGAASFDVVVSNPPYMSGQDLINQEEAVAIARHELKCNFKDVAEQAAAVLKDHGRFYMIHRPQRLAELICTLHEAHLEPKRMRLVYPYVDKEPTLVLIEAMKGGNQGMRVEKPLLIYEEPGVYTKDIREMYGDGR